MALDPRIPRLAELRAGQDDDVFRALWPQPTEVAALARAAGAQFPDDYRDVLRHVGCGELKFGVLDFVARHCFRHVHAFADLSDVSDERALLVTVGHALFGAKTITRWDALEESLRSLVLHNDTVILEVSGWEAAREQIGARSEFLPEVCSETGARFLAP